MQSLPQAIPAGSELTVPGGPTDVFWTVSTPAEAGAAAAASATRQRRIASVPALTIPVANTPGVRTTLQRY